MDMSTIAMMATALIAILVAIGAWKKASRIITLGKEGADIVVTLWAVVQDKHISKEEIEKIGNEIQEFRAAWSALVTRKQS